MPDQTGSPKENPLESYYSPMFFFHPTQQKSQHSLAVILNWSHAMELSKATNLNRSVFTNRQPTCCIAAHLKPVFTEFSETVLNLLTVSCADMPLNGFVVCVIRLR